MPDMIYFKGPPPQPSHQRHPVTPLDAGGNLKDEKHLMARTLKECEEELKRRGVVDVKFHLQPGVSLEETHAAMVQFLNDYLDGKGTPVDGIGDAQCPST